MKFQNSISVLCLLSITTVQVLSAQNIHPSVILGKGTKIAPDVIIKEHSIIGDYVSIEAETKIYENCIIETGTKLGRRNIIDASSHIHSYCEFDYGVYIKANTTINKYAKITRNGSVGRMCQIGEHFTLADSNVDDYVIVGNNVTIEGSATVGSRTTIGNGVYLEHNLVVGRNVTLGDFVRVSSYTGIGTLSSVGKSSNVAQEVRILQSVQIGEHCKIGEAVNMNRFARIGNHVDITSRAYLGISSNVGSNVSIGYLAIIHDYARIPQGNKIQPAEVVIPTPSSIDLYRDCSKNVSSEHAKIAQPSGDGSISYKFNDLMRKLIDREIDALNKNCSDNPNPFNPYEPLGLPEMISLYLINYHGLNLFNIYVQDVKGDNNTNHWVDCSKPYAYLTNELHLGPQSERDILEPDVKKMFIKLLIIGKESTRYWRYWKEDRGCGIYTEILTERRKLTLSERPKEC